MNGIRNLVEFEFFRLGDYAFTLGSIFMIIAIIIIAIATLWTIKKSLFRKQKDDNFEKANIYSIFQIMKYIIWVVSVFLILNTLGIDLSVILAGSAALLVGVGLGLQDTFKDFISGIVLLFEGSIKVGDVLEIDDSVVKLRKIGLRTSIAITRDDIVVILPNSIITSNKVINWSHQAKKTRFRVTVGVAYGSDVDLVIDILKQSALEHPKVHHKSVVNARFIDFGDSSLDFELLFFNDNIFRIENIKSEIRVIINRKFIENNISIPFPQMDLHLRSDYTGRLQQQK